MELTNFKDSLFHLLLRHSNQGDHGWNSSNSCTHSTDDFICATWTLL